MFIPKNDKEKKNFLRDMSRCSIGELRTYAKAWSNIPSLDDLTIKVLAHITHRPDVTEHQVVWADSLYNIVQMREGLAEQDRAAQECHGMTTRELLPVLRNVALSDDYRAYVAHVIRDAGEASPEELEEVNYWLSIWSLQEGSRMAQEFKEISPTWSLYKDVRIMISLYQQGRIPTLDTAEIMLEELLTRKDLTDEERDGLPELVAILRPQSPDGVD